MSKYTDNNLTEDEIKNNFDNFLVTNGFEDGDFISWLFEEYFEFDSTLSEHDIQVLRNLPVIPMPKKSERNF